MERRFFGEALAGAGNLLDLAAAFYG